MAKINKVEDVDKAMGAKIVDPNSLVYYDPRNDDRFVIEGLAFFNENNKEYFRIPLNKKGLVSDAVYWLAGQPSGGQIRFITNAKKISVKIKNKGDYLMCHMACTGQQGVDLYYKRKKERKYTFFTCAKFSAPTSDFESIIFEADEKEEKEIIINLPLYEGLEEILIATEQDAYIKKAKDRKIKGKVVIYGTSITQGGCASRPGMAFSNILSRRLDVEFINLGFSGSGLGEIELAKIATSIDDVNLLILDYEANGGATDDMKDNLVPFIDTFRQRYPLTPILIMSKPPFSNYVFSKKAVDHRNFYFKFQKDVVENKRNNGDENIYFYDGNNIFGKKDILESCVDGTHPTDLGFYRMANSLQPIITKLLKK